MNTSKVGLVDTSKVDLNNKIKKMEICKAPTLQLKALNKHSITHIDVHRDGNVIIDVHRDEMEMLS